MKTKSKRQSQGFGLTGAILLTVLAAVLIAILMSTFTRPRHVRDRRIDCVNNQKQLGIAFRGFGIDLGGLPMTVSTVTNAPIEISEGKVHPPDTAAIPSPR